MEQQCLPLILELEEFQIENSKLLLLSIPLFFPKSTRCLCLSVAALIRSKPRRHRHPPKSLIIQRCRSCPVDASPSLYILFHCCSVYTAAANPRFLTAVTLHLFRLNFCHRAVILAPPLLPWSLGNSRDEIGDSFSLTPGLLISLHDKSPPMSRRSRSCCSHSAIEVSGLLRLPRAVSRRRLQLSLDSPRFAAADCSSEQTATLSFSQSRYFL